VTVLNFFSLDPLKMLTELSAADKKIFFSTIGNKNLLSGYLCITLPVLTILFVEEQRKWLRILCLICLSPGFAALMAADSDSGILGLGLFVAVYLIWYIRHPGKLKRFLLVLTVMLLSARLLRPMAAILPFPSKDMDHLQRLFVSKGIGIGLLLTTAAATVFLYLLDRKKPGLILPGAVPMALAAVFGSALLAVTGVMVFCTVNKELPLQGIWRYFRLEDSWGTNRGFMWRRSMDIFREFSLWRKLFGSGPDTFYYVFEPYFPELPKFWITSTNAAHNEYLNYLITLGVLGLEAYGTALISSVVRCLRMAKQDPMAALFGAAVICYGAQALVSIAQPITTPLLILFLALSAGTGNKTVR
jgi:hypothetical protein